METNKIYLGDTLEVLKTFPDNIIDISVLSPPYNKHGVAGGLVKEVEYKNSSDSKDEVLYQSEQIEVLNELCRVTKPHGHIFYNHKLRWVNAIMIHPMEWVTKTKWNIRQEIIWNRVLSGNIQSWRYWNIDERIYWMQKGITKGEKLASRHAKMTSIWKIIPERGFKEHCAPFPIELPTRCIYSIADLNTGLNVLDPYSGSGSTLVAAKIMGHNYVGIDCSEEYVKLAEARLKLVEDVNYRPKGLCDAERVTMEMNLHNVEKSYQERKKK